MARIAIIGAGFGGHTAALYAGSDLGTEHEVTVITMSERFLYTPSLVWVGVGRMKPDTARFPLRPVYDSVNVRLVVGKATEVHPDERYVMAETRSTGARVRVDYDYLVVATGPHLDFEATPGLGPKAGHTHSICTPAHAVDCRDAYFENVSRMKKGERRKLVIGTGHPGATCQGAAFEYITNIHKDLVRRGVREMAELVWLSNERALGDFGVDGVEARHRGRILSSEDFLAAIFRDYGISWKVQAGVLEVDDGAIHWEDYEGHSGETTYDFAMLIPRFTGMPLQYLDKGGNDVSANVVNQAGYVLVDGIYDRPYEVMTADPLSWPDTYQNPTYEDVFAAGIAFAPPGSISRPHVTPNGTSITAPAPRTGMVAGIIGRIVANNIVDMVHKGHMTHGERMTEMAAACIASMGDSLWDGSAATILIYPVVPNHQRFPHSGGRDSFVTHMEMGLAGAWMKRLIHSTFMHKLQARSGWRLIPE